MSVGVTRRPDFVLDKTRCRKTGAALFRLLKKPLGFEDLSQTLLVTLHMVTSGSLAFFGFYLFIIASGFLPGAGLVSMKRMCAKRQQLVIELARPSSPPSEMRLQRSAICLGATFDTTDMTPLPPTHRSGKVRKTSPETDVKSWGQMGDDVRYLLHRTGGFLYADDVVDLGETLHRGGLDVYGRSARNLITMMMSTVLATFRSAGRALPGWACYRGAMEGRVRARFFGMRGKGNGFLGAVGPRAGNYRAPRALFYRDFHHPRVFFYGEGGRFACGPARYDAAGPVPIWNSTRLLNPFSSTRLLKRRNNHYNRALNIAASFPYALEVWSQSSPS